MASALAVLLLAGCAARPAPVAVAPEAPPPAPATAAPPPARAAADLQPVPDGPVILRAGIALRKLVDVPGGTIRLARDPLSGDLLFLNPADGLFRVPLAAPEPARVAPTAEIVGEAVPSGMAFGPDGALYVVANRSSGTRTRATIVRGTPDGGGGFRWGTVATTAGYPLSNTPFDHLFNGVVVSPDGRWLFVNSGSRTDHGEVQSNGGAYPDTREVALSARILRLPADAADLSLPNDEAALEAAGYIFARGTRNAYDMAFAPDGELFAIDNGPDADYPDELNWIVAGGHYGFPWRFGDQDNPQRRSDYDPTADRLLQPDFTAVKTGAYHNDPAFPPPPGPFRDPVANLGPAAAQFRAPDGSEQDAAAQGRPLLSFTPHRSPLGLAFAGDGMPADLRGEDGAMGAFVLSWGAAGGTLSDRGQDLLHLALRREGDTYVMTSVDLARGFKLPIDSTLAENRLYVLEFGAPGGIWELTFE